MPGPNHSPVPIVRVFGVTENGNSVVAHVHGFMPYFFVSAPDAINQTHLSEFRRRLNESMLRDLKGNQAEGIQDLIISVQCEQKESK